MPERDIVVVGASAGGVQALAGLAQTLPEGFPAAVFVVLHLPPRGTSVLPEILARAGSLPSAAARNGEPIQPGRIYVCPPDHHLLIEPGRIVLSRGPRENNHRPAIDPLFRSAALAYRHRVISVVLSGTLDDGTLGSLEVKRLGGVTVAQAPDDALYPDMPRNAIEGGAIEYVRPINEIGPLLERLTHEPVPAAPALTPGHTEVERIEIARARVDTADAPVPGTPSVFVCPDCGGTLWETHEGEVTHFRCRVGHAFGPDSLLEAKSVNVESALWTALRALDEKGALIQRLRDRAADQGWNHARQRYERALRHTDESADLLRRVIGDGETITYPPPEADLTEVDPPA